MRLTPEQIAAVEEVIARAAREERRRNNALMFAVRADKPFTAFMANLLGDKKLSLVKGERAPLPRPRQR